MTVRFKHNPFEERAFNRSMVCYHPSVTQPTEIIVALLRDHANRQRFHTKKYRRAVNNLITNVIAYPQAQHRYQRSFTRQNIFGYTAAGCTAFNFLIDTLAELGYLHDIKGYCNYTTKEGYCSRFSPTEAFQTFLLPAQSSWTSICSRIQYFPKPQSIYLRDKNKTYLDYRDTKKIAGLKREVDFYNTLLGKTPLTIQDRLIAPQFLHRVYNNGVFTEGGRHYNGDWQNCLKEDRPSIKIGGAKVVELDYSSLHPQMVYNLVSKPCPEDPYELEGIPREVVKKAALIIFNASSPQSAAKALQQELLGSNLPRVKKELAILEAFSNKHPAIKDFFCSGIGTKLQYYDSEITAEILKHFTKLNIPVLPIFDSYLVSSEHEAMLKDTMDTAYKNQMNKFCNDNIIETPSIKKKY